MASTANDTLVSTTPPQQHRRRTTRKRGDPSPADRHHPGGRHILSAAGGPLEHFWAQWQIHLSNKVMRELQGMRVGRLRPSDQMLNLFNIRDPYGSAQCNGQRTEL